MVRVCQDGDTAAAEAADKCTVCESDSCMARVSYRFGWFHYAILSEECPEVTYCLLLS